MGEIEVKVSGKFRFDTFEKGAYPAVGDWVGIKKEFKDDKGIIQAVLPRRSKFSRKVAGKVTEEQVIATNVDIVWIVSGLDNDFNIQRIERYLTLASESGSKPVVILNKSDLCDDPDGRMDEVKRIAPSVAINNADFIVSRDFEYIMNVIKTMIFDSINLKMEYSITTIGWRIEAHAFIYHIGYCPESKFRNTLGHSWNQGYSALALSLFSCPFFPIKAKNKKR